MKRTNPFLRLAAVVTLLILAFPPAAVAQQGSMGGSMKSSMEGTIQGSMKMEGMGQERIPADLDTSTSKVSDNGLFKGDYTIEGSAIQLKTAQLWKLTLVTADDTPVNNATVGVKGQMPGHEHGMVATLIGQSVRVLKKGVYIVEGMAFSMKGWWQVSFNISHEGNSDTLVFDLIIP
jgi:hypothetical protein